MQSSESQQQFHEAKGPQTEIHHANDPVTEHKKPHTGATTVDYVLAHGYQNSTVEDRTAALAIARGLDPGPRIGSWRNVSFIGTMLVACMCSGDNGEPAEGYLGNS